MWTGGGEGANHSSVMPPQGSGPAGVPPFQLAATLISVRMIPIASAKAPMLGDQVVDRHARCRRSTCRRRPACPRGRRAGSGSPSARRRRRSAAERAPAEALAHVAAADLREPVVERRRSRRARRRRSARSACRPRRRRVFASCQLTGITDCAHSPARPMISSTAAPSAKLIGGFICTSPPRRVADPVEDDQADRDRRRDGAAASRSRGSRRGSAPSTCSASRRGRRAR